MTTRDKLIVLDTPDDIRAGRILALKGALKIEVRTGLRRRGQSAYSIVKDEFGFKGNKARVLSQLEDWIAENLF